MIFSKNLDKSLWLILKGEKKDREGILQFIKDIPEEIYKQIYVALGKFDEYEKNEVDIFDRGDICLTGEVLNFDGCKYFFEVDMILGTLTITRSVRNGDNFEKTFELMMYMSNRCNNIENFETQMLGHVYDADNAVDANYDLVNTLLGKMVQKSSKFALKQYSRVSSEELPSDVKIEEIASKNGYSRVRRIY